MLVRQEDVWQDAHNFFGLDRYSLLLRLKVHSEPLKEARAIASGHIYVNLLFGAESWLVDRHVSNALRHLPQLSIKDISHLQSVLNFSARINNLT